jgi:glucose-6-phosphate-specific signal transduction histidine kinase
MVNRSLVRTVGRLTALGIAMIAALVLTTMSLIYSRKDSKMLHDAKNWLLLVVSIIGLFAVVRTGGLRTQPQRSALALLLLAVLLYVSLQDIMEPGFVLSPLTLGTPILQMIIIVVFVAPILVRMLGIKLPDMPASGVVSYPYRR